MRVLVLGATGMLGHKLVQTLQDSHQTYATLRQQTTPVICSEFIRGTQLIPGVSGGDFSLIEETINKIQPDVVVNCIGIVKQLEQAKDSIESITINALLPHMLARFCNRSNARLITLSTDCVFSGKVGNYSVEDQPDPVDLYGRSKLLGEVDESGCLTIRTSMIGRQLIGSHGLVEWLLGQNGKTVKGYKKAIFSGLTTNELSKIIVNIIENQPALQGVWQIAALPVSKFELLNLIGAAYRLDVKILSDDELVCDRSLNGEKFTQATGIVPLEWPDMISQMALDRTNYSYSLVSKC
jgi:dTDP-4-dehydrorhamnose reductase